MSLDPSSPEPGSTRRGMLLGVGLVGVAGTLGACGSKDKNDPAAAQPAGDGGAKAGAALGSASDIPVGGGKIFKDQKIVVTQAKQGEFKAFSARCTHRGCTVDKVDGGKIMCPCHGSEFNATDGSVAHGPATEPLASKAITVENGQIKLG